jgi:hypothetical protein
MECSRQLIVERHVRARRGTRPGGGVDVASRQSRRQFFARREVGSHRLRDLFGNPVVAGLQIDVHTSVDKYKAASVFDEPRKHREHRCGLLAGHTSHVHRDLADFERDKSQLGDLLTLHGHSDPS